MTTITERPTPRRHEDKGSAAPSRSSAPRRDAGAQGAGAGRKPSAAASGAAADDEAAKSPISPSYGATPESARPGGREMDVPRDRGLRRAMFLAELAEARELRRRVAPRRARAAELHARLLRTFRY